MLGGGEGVVRKMLPKNGMPGGLNISSEAYAFPVKDHLIFLTSRLITFLKSHIFGLPLAADTKASRLMSF